MTIEYVNPNRGDLFTLNDARSGEMTCTLKMPDRKPIKWPSKYANLGKRLEEFVPYGQAACLAESSFVGEEAEDIARDYEKLAEYWAEMPDAPTDDPSTDKVWLKFFNCNGSETWYMMSKPNKAGDHAYGYCVIYAECGEYGSFFFNDPRYPKHDIMQMYPLLNVDAWFKPVLYTDFKAQLLMDKIPEDNELG